MFNDRLQKISALMKDSRREKDAQNTKKETAVSAEDSSSIPLNSSVTFDLINDFKRKDNTMVDYNALRNEAIKITVSSDKMLACICITSDFDTKYPFTLEEILEKVSYYGVVFGIQQDILENMATNPEYDTTKVFANGVSTIDGTDGFFTAYFENSQKSKFHINDDKTINFNDLNTDAISAKKGQILGVIIPPVESQDGTDVLGRAVRGIPTHKTKIRFGDNIIIDENNQVISTCAGEIHWTDNASLSISETLRIAGVNAQTGNVKFDGSVIIEGDVLEGFTVVCTGDIIVNGQVFSAKLDAGGSVSVKLGVHGRRAPLCTIRAKGDVTAKFIEQATVDCYGDIITGEIINSRIYARGDIKALAGKGKIIGGECIACGNISASSIGNYANVLTKVTLIGKQSLQREHDQILKQIDRHKYNISKMWETSKIQIFKTKSPIHKDAIIEKTQLEVDRIEERLVVDIELFEKVKSLLYRDSTIGEITTIQETFENVRVTITGTELITNKQYKRSRFLLDNDEIISVYIS